MTSRNSGDVSSWSANERSWPTANRCCRSRNSTSFGARPRTIQNAACTKPPSASGKPGDLIQPRVGVGVHRPQVRSELAQALLYFAAGFRVVYVQVEHRIADAEPPGGGERRGIGKRRQISCIGFELRRRVIAVAVDERHPM